jgi:hypothetical protein
MIYDIANVNRSFLSGEKKYSSKFSLLQKVVHSMLKREFVLSGKERNTHNKMQQTPSIREQSCI